MANEAKTAKKWVWNPLHDYVVDYRIPQSPPPVCDYSSSKNASKILVSELPQISPGILLDRFINTSLLGMMDG